MYSFENDEMKSSEHHVTLHSFRTLCLNLLKSLTCLKFRWVPLTWTLQSTIFLQQQGKICQDMHAEVIDTLHKWHLNLNSNTLYMLSFRLMLQDKGFFTWIWGLGCVVIVLLFKYRQLCRHYIVRVLHTVLCQLVEVTVLATILAKSLWYMYT